MERTEQHKQTLKLANAAVSSGDNEGFLSYCTEDTVWTFIGEQTLRGKDAIRAYMAETYRQPPEFEVDQMIAEGDFVIAIGKIRLTENDGSVSRYAYCDVWRFEDGMLHELKAYVVAEEPKRGDDGLTTVIGSGFTYEEGEHPTDHSEPASQVDPNEIIRLPDLGKPNRP